MEVTGSVEELLSECETPATRLRIVPNFRLVLERLEDPSTRTQAWIFLADLHRRVKDFNQRLENDHFRIQDDQNEDPLHFTPFTVVKCLFAVR